MAKYIIELEDEPMIANSFNHEVDELWKAKGFNSLVFDQNGIKKLIPYIEPDREAIEDEVWELAKKLISMSGNEVSDMIGYTTNFGEVMYNMTYQEAKAKYEAWKTDKDKIRVGDEVKENTGLWTGVVVGFDKSDDLVIMDRSGNSCCGYKTKYFRKTGRHFDEVEALLKKMRGGIMTIEEAIQELAKIFKQALDNVGDCFLKIREHAEEEE